MYQLLKGVEFIHNNKVFHRDLKPQNLLISNEKVMKIADFGLARNFGIPVKSYTHEVVTLWYRCPEVLLGSRNYNTTIDTWSIGCIFAEMITSKPLFDGNNEQEQLKKIFKIRGTPNEHDYQKILELPDWINSSFDYSEGIDLKDVVAGIDDLGCDLLDKFLQINPDKRISISDALNHDYFKDLSESVKNLYISKSEKS